MQVTVYTLPSCVQCDTTKRYLDKGKIDYSIVDLSTNEDAYEMIKALGYQQAPVVIAGDEHWSGFRPDMISKLSVA